MKKHAFKLINTLFVVFPMTFIMAFAGTVRNYGFGKDWSLLLLKSWSVMFPIAYGAALVIIPNARKLTEKLTSNSQRNK